MTKRKLFAVFVKATLEEIPPKINFIIVTLSVIASFLPLFFELLTNVLNNFYQIVSK